MNKPTNPQFKDLTGLIFGKLTILEYAGCNNPEKKRKGHKWLCSCQCGNQVTVTTAALKKSGNPTYSCGCDKKMDLMGQTFGKLTVLEYAGCRFYPENNNRCHLWLCQCECGKQTTVTIGNLRNTIKPVRSCGCSRKGTTAKKFINMEGQKFGILTVGKYIDTRRGHTHWMCKCECGNEKSISSQSLKKGLTKSCGCRQKFGRYKHGLSGTYAHKKLMFQDPAKKIRHNISGAIRKVLKGAKRGSSVLDYLLRSAGRWRNLDMSM